MKKKINQILVIYVGVAGIRSEDIPAFVKRITEKISPKSIEAEIIVIPVQKQDTRIECINPIYITNEKLIEQHEELIKKLNEELQYQAELLKNKNNE
jgi:hypothetical protein